jgi:hypothetical protein
VFGDRLYLFDASLVLRLSDGGVLGSFTSEMAPAIDASMRVDVVKGALVATDLTSSAKKWTAGSDITLPPLIVGPNVVGASKSGDVLIIDSATGAIRSTANVGALEATTADAIGMTAAGGMLFVPAGERLVAF